MPGECAKCGIAIQVPATWRCWWCGADLCDRCGDEHGHCGHDEAERINRVTAEARTWDERDQVLRDVAKRRRN